MQTIRVIQKFGWLIAFVVLALSLAPAPPRIQAAMVEAQTDGGKMPPYPVTSAADSGPGRLRQELTEAQNGDIITFDPAVFPPSAPVIISLSSGLPEVTQGNLTIDASNAGVILNGSNIGTTPQTLLLDDVNLRLDGGPNLIANGDFSAGLGHWRPWPWEEGPGMTRGLNSSEFHSSPQSYEWDGTHHRFSLKDRRKGLLGLTG